MEKDRQSFLQRIWQRICAWVPHKVGNSTVVHVLGFLSALKLPHRKRRESNLVRNRRAMAEHEPVVEAHGGYIEDQHAYSDLRYGKTTVSYSGCEIIACCNALHALGVPGGSLPELISRFEKRGMIFSGLFGTAPHAMTRFLCSYGCAVEETFREPEFEWLAQGADCLILTMYNDRDDVRREIHTVCVTSDPCGFIAHNVCGDGTVFGPEPDFTSLMKKLNGGRAKGICLQAVSRPKK